MAMMWRQLKLRRNFPSLILLVFFSTKFKLTNKSKEGFEDNEEADSKSS